MSNSTALLIGNVIAIVAILLPILLAKFGKIDQKFEEIMRQYNAQAIQINSILVGDLQALREKQKIFEERFREVNEWIKTLRKRTHGLANEAHAQRIDLELVKKGQVGGPIEPRTLADLDATDAEDN